MATEAPVNGNYAPHQGYGGLEQHSSNNYGYAGNSSTPSQAAATNPPPPSSSTGGTTASAPQQADVSKDEVGWYFVEQYYTTLSRSPEKLYLFYNKRSQFVSGQETDKVSVCVGQKAINDRIKELDFHDCKVRVTNVDSQASDSNIVIQVIGEISNRSQPHKKFTQTFVLATQPTGYFVLNDIFRYLIDEEDEPEQTAEASEGETQTVPLSDSGYQEPPPTVTGTEPKALTDSSDPNVVEHDAAKVDREIDSSIPAEQRVDAAEPKTNGTSPAEPEAEEEEEPIAEEVAAAAAAEEPAAEEAPAPAVEEQQSEPQKPTPEPAAAQSAPTQTPAQPVPAPKPAAPKTWASLAASANRVATPAAASPASSSTSQTKPTPKPTAAASTPTPTAAAQSAPVAPAPQRESSPADNSQGDEWTAVSNSHNRNQSRQANTQPESPMYRGYVSKVHQGIDGNQLKAHLATFGEVLYFDIAQQKNCAFVDFKTAEGYNSAVAANPHTISGEDLYLEERKFRPGATPYIPRGQYQGRGRGGPQGAPRGNYQNRGGNGYAPRGGRGGNGAPRGRGSSIAT